MLNRHDEALLRDLRLQPIWLLGLYIAVGILAAVTGFLTDGTSSRLLCLGGGFLIALGAEKLVSRRIRNAALRLVEGGPTARTEDEPTP